MPRDTQVEQAKFVSRQTVSPWLLHHRTWFEQVEYPVNDFSLILQLLDIADSSVKWKVDWIPQPVLQPNVINPAAAGEEVALLVQAECHHPPRGLKCLLYPIAVVTIYIYVQHPVLLFEQFNDC